MVALATSDAFWLWVYKDYVVGVSLGRGRRMVLRNAFHPED